MQTTERLTAAQARRIALAAQGFAEPRPTGRVDARHIRRTLAPDGTWLIAEPHAADTISGNLNPIGRIYYAGSTLLCISNALSQPGGYTLGAQAGEAAIRQLVTDAEFTRFRRAAETPFNLIYEARP